MKYLAFLIATLTVYNVYATQNSSCELEEYFRQTEVYKSAVLDNEAKQLEMERESLSLLPDISANVGQQSTNNSSFKGINESSVSLGLSQSVYSGGRYNKFKNKILNDIEYNDLMINDKRNRYLIDLYRSIIDYNYKADLYKLHSSQLDKQKEQLEVAKAKLISGDIAKIEYDIISLRKEEIQKDVDVMRNEVKQSELDIKTQFNIPLERVKKITSKHILSCKVMGSSHILNKGRILLNQSENSNYELRMASMQPSVSLSLNMRPPSGGTLNNITTKKTDFSASVNVTLPLSSFFSVNNIKNDYAISIER
ncbi:TolC family protein, partial [Salmonella enterica subsp. salamae]|nr:TolC family protein [Salmonella enterica subsp. salamae]